MKILFRTLLVLLIGVVFHLVAPAQAYREYVSVDTNTLHNISLFSANSIVALANGEMVVAGAITGTDSLNWTRQSVYVMKATQAGQVLSYHEYEDVAPFLFQGPRTYGVCADGQGALYIACGSNGRQIIVKAEESGSLDWARAQHHHEFYDAICSSTGVTFLGQDESVQGLHDFSIGQFDADGNGGTGMMFGTPEFELPEKLVELPDGGFLMVGSSSLNGDFRMMVVRVDAALQLVWGKIYADTVEHRRLFAKGVEIGQDGYYIGGYVDATNVQQQDSLLMTKIDTAGNILWTQLYGHPDWIGVNATGMEKAPGGRLYMGANVKDTGYYHPVLVKFDANGNALLAQAYDDGNPNSEEVVTSITWGDGQLLATGERVQISPTFQISRDIFFARLDDSLQMGCNEARVLGSHNISLQTLGGIMSQPLQVADTMHFAHRDGNLIQLNACYLQVGLEATDAPTALLQFQNPAPSTWRVQANLPASDGIFELMDLQGRVLLREALPQGNSELHLSTTAIPQGMYMVHVRGLDWKSSTQRVLIVR
jgi:hypothetical protein